MADITAPTFSAIASECIPALKSSTAWLKATTTNFSSEFGKLNQTVTVVSAQTAGSVRTFDHTTGYGNTDGGLNTTPVQLTDRLFLENTIPDVEFQSLTTSQLTELTMALVNQVSAGVQDLVCGKILASVCEENEAVNPDDFTASSLSPIRKHVVAMRLPADKVQMVLNPVLYTGLITDPRIMLNTASDIARSATSEGKIARIAGWNVHEASALPDNDEGLAGLVLFPSALAVACRPVRTIGADFFEVISDPDTGFSLGIKVVSDPMHAKASIVVETLVGASVVLPKAILRLTESTSGDENP